ncbi:MAG TPA: hypothetical protein VN650_02140 [Gemmatimonadaceae bacterium]|nr:hypothetical protein [Gemmatimonadaceae bacterium]
MSEDANVAQKRVRGKKPGSECGSRTAGLSCAQLTVIVVFRKTARRFNCTIGDHFGIRYPKG